MPITLNLSTDDGVIGTLTDELGQTVLVMESDDDEGVRVVEAPGSDHRYMIFVSRHTQKQIEDLSPDGRALFNTALGRVAELLLR